MATQGVLDWVAKYAERAAAACGPGGTSDTDVRGAWILDEVDVPGASPECRYVDHGGAATAAAAISLLPGLVKEASVGEGGGLGKAVVDARAEVRVVLGDLVTEWSRVEGLGCRVSSNSWPSGWLVALLVGRWLAEGLVDVSNSVSRLQACMRGSGLNFRSWFALRDVGLKKPVTSACAAAASNFLRVRGILTLISDGARVVGAGAVSGCEDRGVVEPDEACE